jgi:glycosyltransferase involved in cell wall biosynthesis
MRVGLVCLDDVDYGLDLTNTLHELGVNVSLYLSHRKTSRVVDADRPLERIYELGLVPQNCKVRLFRFPRLRDPRSFVTYWKLSQSIHDDKVDVVHFLAGPGEIWLAALAYFLRDIPLISTMIIPKPNIKEALSDIVVYAEYNLLAYGSDIIIVNGANQVDLVSKLYHVPTNRIAYVPLGPRVTAVKWSARKNCEEQGTVLFFGAARPHKGLEFLIRAQPEITRQVPDAHIVIASYGPDMERCKQMIQDCSKFEIYEGFVPGDLAAAFFERASLVVLPYLSASTSGILMTAYVFGKPVVATRVGSLPEYVSEGVTGFLVPPYDSEQLSNAIIRLLVDDLLRLQMGQNAIRWVNEKQVQAGTETLGAYKKAIDIHKSA